MRWYHIYISECDLEITINMIYEDGFIDVSDVFGIGVYFRPDTVTALRSGLAWPASFNADSLLAKSEFVEILWLEIYEYACSL